MNGRTPEYPINKLFINRWSPRAMSGQELTDAELMSLFEAARWAPSSYNNQPWRFIYAKKNTPYWDTFLNLLVPGNQVWAKNAAVLIVLIAHKNFEYNKKPSRTHAFDAGAAWENLALQATINGIVAHGMEGFDYNVAQTALNIPNDYEVLAMVALGKPGSVEVLPEKLQTIEKPNDRKKVEEFAFEGKFKE